MRDFYLCHNPFGKMPPGRVAYIYHPDNPRVFVSVIEIDYSQRLIDFNFKGCNVMFQYHRADGKRRLFLMIVMQGGARNTAATLALLKDAAGWYCTCLNKEDVITYGKNGGWSLMHPYNKDKAPNLDVLHIQATDQYLMSYGNGTFCVDGLDSLYTTIDFLYKDVDDIIHKNENTQEEGAINFA